MGFDKRRKGSRSKLGLEALGPLKMAPKTASYKAKMGGTSGPTTGFHSVLRRVSLLDDLASAYLRVISLLYDSILAFLGAVMLLYDLTPCIFRWRSFFH